MAKDDFVKAISIYLNEMVIIYKDDKYILQCFIFRDNILRSIIWNSNQLS